MKPAFLHQLKQQLPALPLLVASPQVLGIFFATRRLLPLVFPETKYEKLQNLIQSSGGIVTFRKH